MKNKLKFPNDSIEKVIESYDKYQNKNDFIIVDDLEDDKESDNIGLNYESLEDWFEENDLCINPIINIPLSKDEIDSIKDQKQVVIKPENTEVKFVGMNSEDRSIIDINRENSFSIDPHLFAKEIKSKQDKDKEDSNNCILSEMEKEMLCAILKRVKRFSVNNTDSTDLTINIQELIKDTLQYDSVYKGGYKLTKNIEEYLREMGYATERNIGGSPFGSGYYDLLYISWL